MGFAARILMALISKIKGLGFLEWAGIASLVDTILTYNVKQELFRIVAEEMSNRAGLALNPDDPFSDASVSNAVGEKIGVPLRSIKDPAKLREDLEEFAAVVLSDKTGYHFSTVTDVNQLKEDILKIGAAELSKRVGIPAGVMPGEGDAFEPDEVKKRLLVWAKAEIMADMGGETQIIADDITQVHDVAALAEELNKRLLALGSDETVTGRQVAVKMCSDIAVAAIVDYQKVAAGSAKRSRRQESLRDAQRKFRATHGNRQKYVPLGQVATFDDESPPTIS